MEKSQCSHPRPEGPVKVTVLGVELEFESVPMCLPCAEQYLNQHSIRCVACQEPITPGTPVCDGAYRKDGHIAYVHVNCAGTLAGYCGVWGEGRRITLHELKPEKYPEGTFSVVSHVVVTRQSVVEGID